VRFFKNSAHSSLPIAIGMEKGKEVEVVNQMFLEMPLCDLGVVVF